MIPDPNPIPCRRPCTQDRSMPPYSTSRTGRSEPIPVTHSLPPCNRPISLRTSSRSFLPASDCSASMQSATYAKNPPSGREKNAFSRPIGRFFRATLLESTKPSKNRPPISTIFRPSPPDCTKNSANAGGTGVGHGRGAPGPHSGTWVRTTAGETPTVQIR